MRIKFRSNVEIASTSTVYVVSQTITASGEFVGVLSIDNDDVEFLEEWLEANLRFISFSYRA